MVLSYERYTAEEERFNEQRCRETRLECGLPAAVDGVDCDGQICKKFCPFERMVV